MVSEEMIVGCMSCAETSNPVAGSTVDVCTQCGCSVWISPATRQATLGVRVVCMGCVAKLMEQHEMRIIPPSQGQVREIVDDMNENPEEY